MPSGDIDFSGIQDEDVRLLFKKGSEAGVVRFTQAMTTSVETYYFFQWRDGHGLWQDALAAGPDIIGFFKGMKWAS